MEFKNLLKKLKESGEISAYDYDKDNKINEIKKYFNGEIPSTFLTFLEEIGSCDINGFDFNGTGGLGVNAFVEDHENNKAHLISNEIPLPPESYVLISDIGDDVVWYFDVSIRNNKGECPVVGWINGLGQIEQPEWLSREENFENFEEFFKVKAEVNQISK